MPTSKRRAGLPAAAIFTSLASSLAFLACSASPASDGPLPTIEMGTNCVSTTCREEHDPPPRPPPPRPLPPVYPHCPPGMRAPACPDRICAADAASQCTWVYPNEPFGVPGDQPPFVTAVAIGAHSIYAIAEPFDWGEPPAFNGAVGAQSAVFAWGSNTHYELGNGTTQSSSYPVTTLWIDGDKITAIAAGDAGACALDAAGTVYCWGTIATSPSIAYPKPTKIALPGAALAITHGARHACALLDGGQVHCWGDNDAYQLGDASSKAGRAAPYHVPHFTYPASAGLHGDAKMDSFAAAGASTCAIDTNQNLWCWGDNSRGSLGINSNVTGTPLTATAQPQFVGYGTATALSGGGAGTFCANLQPGPTASGWHCWGANDRGQAGLAQARDVGAPLPAQPGVRGAGTIAIGAKHGCAGGQSGSLFTTPVCFGDDTLGQIGNGTSGPAPVLTATEVDAASLADLLSPPQFASVAAGGAISCGITTDMPWPVTNTRWVPNNVANLACWGVSDTGPADVLGPTRAPAFLPWFPPPPDCRVNSDCH